MVKTTKQYLYDIMSIASRYCMKNKDRSQEHYLQNSSLKVDQTLPLFMGDELEIKVYKCIRECYPGIKSLYVKIYPSKSYIDNGKYCDRYTIYVNWTDGIAEYRIQSIVNCALCNYLEETCGSIENNWIKVKLIRAISEDAVLRKSQQYADCIAKGIIVNSNNIHYLCIGGVSLYKLAIGELRLLDEIQ